MRTQCTWDKHGQGQCNGDNNDDDERDAIPCFFLNIHSTIQIGI